MKKKFGYILPFCLLLSLSCEQEVVTTVPPEGLPPDTSCEDAVAGDLDFSKFIALGNSFVAGVQGGALFTEGQDNSLAAILNKQFECAGAPSTFNQPDIGAELGWNLFITQPFLGDGTSPVLGRMLLQYGDNTSCATGAPSPLPTPQAYPAGEKEAVPNPAANPSFMYAGNKAELNNFSVPAITIGQALITETGNWALAGVDPRFQPFYGRFASAPGTSRILSDASAAQGTFALVWLGLDDFFLHAAFGADGTLAPLTSSGAFATYLGYIFDHPASIGLFDTNPDLEVVIGNFPDIFKMPHFTSVSYNPIPLEEADVDQLTAGFAGYNTLLDGISANAGLLAGFSLDAAELQSRKVSWTVGCTNKILLVDETLDDLGAVFDYLRSVGQIPSDEARAALVPYEQVRHTTATDVIPLSTGSVLGEDGTFGVMGVSEPVGDRYVIIPSEKEDIDEARAAFNESVQDIVDLYPNKVVLADVDAALSTLITEGKANYSGVVVTPNINPPTGIYSEDGAHFNTRGYAFISRTFIAAINAEFGSTVPLTNISQYSATGLPIP